MNDTNGTTFSKEYFYLDHPIHAENMTISVVAESSFCMNVSLYGRKAECKSIVLIFIVGQSYSF